MKEKEQQLAIFWCHLLYKIIYNDIEPSSYNQYLKEQSRKLVRFPNGKEKTPSLTTLKRKLNAFQEGGFDALARKPRSDRNKPRKVTTEIIEKAVEYKLDQPLRSANTINRFLDHHNNVTIPRSTLYRHLKQHNATRLKLGLVKKKVRCRWTRETSNDLWVGDFSNGPYVYVDGEILPTYLSLFIDCHSRYVVVGRYYLRQSLDVLIDSLLRAWTMYGLSNDLYLDNAKVYHAKALKAACYALHTKLIHRTKGDPAPGGLVERIIGTTQNQFETEVKAGDILTLDKLNEGFQAWLNVVYHKAEHSETNETPANRYRNASIRSVDLNYAISFFMHKEKRKVDRDFSDVSINTKLYIVDKIYRGDSVIVHYDPFSVGDRVFLYNEKEEFLTTGILHNREKREWETTSQQPPKKPKHNYIDMIVGQHKKQIEAKAKPIDFTKLKQRQQWPFAAFLKRLGFLMGRKGGVSSFTAGELETLKRAYDKYPDINDPRLTHAFECAEVKTIHHIVFQLQNIQEK